MTKREAKAHFLSVSCEEGLNDKPAMRYAWGLFTDMLCKDGYITLKQYETWTCPFWVHISYIKTPTFPAMTVINQPRKINNNVYDMPTVDGLDRCEINTKLHYLNVEIDKLRAKQAALIEMRNQLDRHAEMQEMGNLFDDMFGGWLHYSPHTFRTPMKTFRVNTIQFDFKDDNFEASPQMQQDIISETIEQVWYAEDEDDLIEEITSAMGFCVLSIDYDYMLKSMN